MSFPAKIYTFYHRSKVRSSSTRFAKKEILQKVTPPAITQKKFYLIKNGNGDEKPADLQHSHCW